MDRQYAVQGEVLSAGAIVATLARRRAAGLWGTVLQPAQGTDHQEMELHAVYSVVQMQEAEAVPPSLRQ